MNWDVVYTLTGCAQVLWVWCYCARVLFWLLGRRAPAAVNWIFFEGRPIIPALLVVVYVVGGIASGTDGMGWRLFSLLCGFWIWFVARDEKDDDDRWNKRAKKLTARVAQVGGRLQIVPAGGKS